jgi:hypothetical protein
MTITISGSGTIGGPTTFTDNVTLGTSLLATPSGATPSYLCRAWVNFNGTGTVAIRASGNVTSITDNGTGDYTVNFTTAMTDANYAVCFGAVSVAATDTRNLIQIKGTLAGGATTMTTTAVRIQGGDTANASAPSDNALTCVSVFR